MNTSEKPQSPIWFLLLTTLVLSAGFFAAMHRLTISQVTDFNLQTEFEEIVAGGDVGRRFGFVLLAGFGAACLACCSGVSLSIRGPLALVLLLGLSWCFASVAWSIDPQISTRRLTVLAFCLVAGFGLAKQLSVQELTLVALATCATSALVGVGAEIFLGTFRPWTSDYRFAGTLHPNVQGLQCGLMGIAAIALSLHRRQPSVFVIPTAAAVVLLLLTKSRTALAAFAIAAFAMWLVRLPRNRIAFVLVLVVFSACLLLYTRTALGPDSTGGVPSFVLMGRTEDASTLSGRTDAWTAVLPYVQQNPLLGSGYGAFWNLGNIAAVSQELQWYATNSHSAYLDAALELGVPGSFLLTCLFMLGLRRTATLARRTDDPGNLFLFSLLVLIALDACLESLVIQPMLASLLACAGIARISCFRPVRASRGLHEPQASARGALRMENPWARSAHLSKEV